MAKTYYKRTQFGSIRIVDKNGDPLAVFSDDAIYGIFVAGIVAAKDELFDEDTQQYVVSTVDKLMA